MYIYKNVRWILTGGHYIMRKGVRDMARFTQDITLNKPDDFVTLIMNDYLQKNNYVTSDWKGEPAYRTGDAFVEGFKFLKWSYGNGVLHLEVWMKGTFGGEWGLTGFVGALPKKQYKQSIDQLIEVLKQPIPEGGAQEAEGGIPTPVMVQTVDNHGAATRALVLGILSVVFSFIIPLIGLVLGCFGISSARMGMASSKGGQAKAGRVLSIIGIVISAATWILNVVFSVALVMG